MKQDMLAFGWIPETPSRPTLCAKPHAASGPRWVSARSRLQGALRGGWGGDTDLHWLGQTSQSPQGINEKVGVVLLVGLLIFHLSQLLGT